MHEDEGKPCVLPKHIPDPSPVGTVPARKENKLRDIRKGNGKKIHDKLKEEEQKRDYENYMR